MTTYVFAVEAAADLDSALAYYRAEARPGTTEKFVERIDEAIQSILRDPEGCPIFHRQLRRQRVWKFPYDLLFRSENDMVTIVAVAHHWRDAESWKHRQ